MTTKLFISLSFNLDPFGSVCLHLYSWLYTNFTLYSITFIYHTQSPSRHTSPRMDHHIQTISDPHIAGSTPKKWKWHISALQDFSPDVLLSCKLSRKTKVSFVSLAQDFLILYYSYLPFSVWFFMSNFITSGPCLLLIMLHHYCGHHVFQAVQQVWFG